MKNITKFIRLILPLCIWFVSATAQKTTAASDRIIIKAAAPVAPVLKGLAANPLLCITIYVPAGMKPVTYKNLSFTLNAAGVSSIEKLELFFNGSEPAFTTAAKPIATNSKVSTNFILPASITANPGLTYLWVSATLKTQANINSKITLHATALMDDAKKMHAIKEDASVAKKYTGIAVRKINDEGVHTYRIPGIATTTNGTLIAVYDVRYNNDRDLPGNIDVGMSRSTDGGQTWEPMKIIMDMGAPHENNGCGDPTVLVDPVTKKIWVAALWSKGNRSIAGSKPGLSPDTTGQFIVVSSDDDGRTWTTPISISSQIKNPTWHLYFNGPGNGIAMQNGTLVFPSQYWDENKIPHSAIIYSTDHGATWRSSIGAKSKTTESQVVETTPGTLMLNMRNDRGNFRMVTTTTDLGKTWTEHHTSNSALQEPVCMASFIKAKVNVKGVKKDVLFFSNPNTSNGRHNLTIKASFDLGETWQPANQLLIDERKSYGYSSLTKINDDTIGLLYEGNRELYFVAIPVKDIIK